MTTQFAPTGQCDQIRNDSAAATCPRNGEKEIPLYRLRHPLPLDNHSYSLYRIGRGPARTSRASRAIGRGLPRPWSSPKASAPAPWLSAPRREWRESWDTSFHLHIGGTCQLQRSEAQLAPDCRCPEET